MKKITNKKQIIDILDANWENTVEWDNEEILDFSDEFHAKLEESEKPVKNVGIFDVGNNKSNFFDGGSQELSDHMDNLNGVIEVEYKEIK